MATVAGRVVRDPVYGYVVIPNSLVEVVDHRLVQRLRRVSQTSLASSVYPSMTGTRFEHAIGSMHLAGIGWSAAWDNSPRLQGAFQRAVESTVRLSPDVDFPTIIRDAVSCVALLHDVGHSPFSHCLEPLYERDFESILDNPALADAYRKQAHRTRFHEFAGLHICRKLAQLLMPELRDLVIAIYEADDTPSWAGALKALVAGEIDVDRVDYLMRDAQGAGTEYGAIDYVRLLSALEIHERKDGFVIAPGLRARSAAEHLLVQRSLAYRWIYFHPRVVAADLCMLRAVETLRDLADSRIVARIGRVAVSIGSAFRALLPRLDYVSTPPGSGGEFADAITEEVDVTINDLIAAAPSGPESQALVDDSTVIEWLKRGSGLARLLLSHSAHRELDFVLRRFLTYYEAALLREKNFWPCWKGYEEYRAVAVELRDRGDFAQAVSDTFGRLRKEFPNQDSVHEYLERQGQLLLQHLDGSADTDPVLALNNVASLILRVEPKSLASFLDLTPMPVDREKGFWDAIVKSFGAVKSGRQMGLLYRAGKPVPLAQISRPWVGDLNRAEEHDVKLFVFFFRVVSAPTTREVVNAVVRERLRAVFVDQFPRFVKEKYADAVRALVFGQPQRTAGAAEAGVEER